MDDYIKEKVFQLKKEYETDNPFELLKELGVEVKYNYDFTKLKAFYAVVLDNPYVVLNGNLDEYSLKTVAAHELGHHILHKDFAVNSPLREMGFYDAKSGPEYEANLFAAELLIDDEALISCLEEQNDYFNICAIMNVSPELMAFKIKMMNGKGNKLNIPIVCKSDFLEK